MGSRDAVELREAYEELSVEPGTAPKKARRAYLRLLKKHKPETDPEGFQRIRSAWERIKDAPEWEVESLRRPPLEDVTAEELAGGTPGEPGPPGEAGEGAPKPAPSWSKPERSWAEQVKLSHEGKLFDRAAPKPASPGPVEPPPDVEPGTLAWFLEKGRFASDAERVDIAREAVAALPTDPEAWWMLHEALLVTNRITEAAAALRDAHRRGLEGFLEPLVRQHPEHVERLELDEARRAAREGRLSPLAVANSFLVRGDAETAGAVFRDAFDDDARAPTVHVALDFVLRLARAEHAGVARECHERVARWLRETGREVEIAGSAVGVTYALAQELAALPLGFPPPVRAALAQAILDGDPAFAVPRLASWLDAQPKETKAVEEQLLVHAPTLHRALRPAFQMHAAAEVNRADGLPPPPRPVGWTGSGGGSRGEAPARPPASSTKKDRYLNFAIFAVLAVVALVAVLVKMNAPPTPRYRLPDLPTPTPPAGRGLTSPTEASLARMGGAADAICRWDRESPECAQASALADALIIGDCSAARTARAELAAALDSRGSRPPGEGALDSPDSRPIATILMREQERLLASGLRRHCAAEARTSP